MVYFLHQELKKYKSLNLQKKETVIPHSTSPLKVRHKIIKYVH